MSSRHLQAVCAGALLVLACGGAAGENCLGPPLGRRAARPQEEWMLAAFRDERVSDLPDDEKVLKDSGVATDGPGLLAYLRKRTLGPDGEARLRKLVKDLGDDEFEVRQKAVEGLVALGLRARAALRAALKDPDLEVRLRAQRCLDQIDKDAPKALRVSAAVVRLLGERKPAGAVGVLFAYLGAAEDESIAAEARTVLEALAVRAGKPDPVVVAGLKDKSPLRRAAAGVILCKARAAAHLPEVRKLLADPDPEVCYAVGLALAAAREKAAVPALIGTLDCLPARERGRLEAFLYRVAEGSAPALPGGDDEAARRKARAAWQAWWKAHGERLDADRVAEAARTLGHTAVLLLDLRRVVELDAANRVVWQFDGLEMPLDLQRLPGERVLVAEYGGNRVTERGRDGKVVWEKKIAGPLVAQRLANGNTFIATREGVVEVDKAGKQVFSYHRPFGETIMRACKLGNGDMVLVTELGVPRCVRVSREGRELKSFAVEVSTSGGRIDVLPNGHVLVPELLNNRVVERDADGKVVRTMKVEQPIAATRLANGHLLVTSMTQKRAVELDRAGKEVWEYRRDTRVTRAVRP
jgi:HEAT repeat protein